MRRSLSLLLASVAAVGLTVATAGAANASSDCSTVQVDVSSSGHIRLAHHLPAGFLKFDVDGAAGQNIQIVQPRHHASVDTLVTDANLVNGNQPNPVPLERDFTAIGGSSTGTDLFVWLKPGTYYLADTGTGAALTAGLVSVVHVGGSWAEARAPHVTGQVTAVGDMDWAKWPRTIGHEGTLRFVNASTDWHFAELLQLKPGVTYAQLKDVIENNGDPSTISSPTAADYTTGVMAPHHSQLSTYDLPKGHYALMCWWPDENGVPHAMMGMFRLIDLR